MDDMHYRLDFERKAHPPLHPVLAALKPANLFTCRDESVPGIRGNGPNPVDPHEYQDSFSKALRTARVKLAPCGVRIEVLARRPAGPLVYVYRPHLLKLSIQQENVAAYLRKEGYDPSCLSTCIERLHRRICGTDVKKPANRLLLVPPRDQVLLGYPLRRRGGVHRGEPRRENPYAAAAGRCTRRSATPKHASAATKTAPPCTSACSTRGFPWNASPRLTRTSPPQRRFAPPARTTCRTPTQASGDTGAQLVSATRPRRSTSEGTPTR